MEKSVALYFYNGTYFATPDHMMSAAKALVFQDNEGYQLIKVSNDSTHADYLASTVENVNSKMWNVVKGPILLNINYQQVSQIILNIIFHYIQYLPPL